MLSVEAHDPSEVKWYSIDMSPYMGSGVSIASVVWTVPTGITKEAQAETASLAKIKLSGGTHGQHKTLTALVTGDDNETFEQSVFVPVYNSDSY